MELQDGKSYGEIRVRLIENGVVVKVGPRWWTFESWAKASKHIEDRLEVVRRHREEAPK